MKVRVNCPIAGCGTQVDVKYLPRHLENVHELDGEILLRLHPVNPYTHQPELEPELAPEAEPEPEPEKEAEPEQEQEQELEPEQGKKELEEVSEEGVKQ
ncbi:hypothetical protein ES705_10655 [subsurface metagenome]